MARGGPDTVMCVEPRSPVSPPRSGAALQWLRAGFTIASLVGAASGHASDLPRRDLHRFGIDATAREALSVRTGEIQPDDQMRVFLATELEDAPFELSPSGRIGGGGLGGRGGQPSSRSSVSVGLNAVFGRRLELLLRVPMTLSQMGGDPNRWGETHPDVSGFDTPISLRARWGVAAQSDSDPLSVAVSMEVMPVIVSMIPPARGGDLVDSTDERGVSPRLEVGHRFDAWVLGAQLGATFRSPIQYGTQRLGSEVNGGVVAASTRGRLRGELAALGTFNFDGAGPGAEVLGAVRWAWSSCELFAVGGPGIGSAPGIPRFRAVLGISWQTDRIVPVDEDELVHRPADPGTIASPAPAASPEIGGSKQTLPPTASSRSAPAAIVLTANERDTRDAEH